MIAGGVSPPAINAFWPSRLCPAGSFSGRLGLVADAVQNLDRVGRQL